MINKSYSPPLTGLPIQNVFCEGVINTLVRAVVGNTAESLT